MAQTKLCPRKKQVLYSLMSRIYALLNSNMWDIKYVRMRGEPGFAQKNGFSISDVGGVDPSLGVIYVDYREDVLATIVHECLHVIYPNASESLIKKTERFLMENMSRIQARRVHQLSTNCLI